MKTVQRSHRLTPTEQQAIVAAVACGRSQTQVAKEFNVHRNTVCTLVNLVKRGVDNPNNPLADMRQRVHEKAWNAVEAGLDATANPYRRADIGVKVLEGLGEFQQVTTEDRHITVSWITPESASPQTDATPPVIDIKELT